MLIYAVTKSDPVRLVYLGRSLGQAEACVGTFQKYERPVETIPEEFMLSYSALPENLSRKPLKWYMADGWWYMIEQIEYY